MRILFLEKHPMWIHGLPRGFKDLGHEVNICEISSKSELFNTVANYNPHIIFSMGWTREHRKEKQSWLKEYLEKTNIPHVYWATEDPTHTKTFTLPLIKNSKIDFIFTICPSLVKVYKKLGLPSARLDFGYHPDTHYITKSEPKYTKSIAVVANAYPHLLRKNTNLYRYESTKTLIEPLIKANIRVDFWGVGWKNMQDILGVQIPNDWIHGYIHYLETPKVYSSSDIIIGLQNQQNQLTQRTFEILGSEGFLITSDTQEIRRLFTPGYHLITSSSKEETVELVKHYLLKTEERDVIRKRGKDMVAKNHTYKHRALYIIDILKRNGIIEK
ncbi:glycosyltransferase [Bacillus sp. SCS-151]|uniref:CgeB family protein n=1 Tax=Nanhaiella sioensis TaxID=3115293 RepID=UPI00397E86CF